MDHYRDNAKWLTYLTPFRGLTISAAYLTPFYLSKGLSLSQIFLLQSIFSVAVLLWELPSGYIADKIGRAFSIKLSAPFAAASMIAYGFSSHYWQFVVCELILAVSYGLISGIDTALLIDSLKADNRESEFVKLSQRMNAFGYASTALGVPLAIVLVKYVSLSSTLMADGLLVGVGFIFAYRLVEVPRFDKPQEELRLSAMSSMKQVLQSAEARWMIALGAALNASTYFAFWLSAPYYQSMGIPVVLFSAILAVRSLWKAWLSHRVRQKHHVERYLFTYATLAGLVYLAMASRQLWLVWAVLGHDAVQALQGQPLTEKLNLFMNHEYRATMNSLVNLLQRLVYSLFGPLVGLVVDKKGLSVGFVVTGAVCSTLAFVALFRLHQLKTFQERR